MGWVARGLWEDEGCFEPGFWRKIVPAEGGLPEEGSLGEANRWVCFRHVLCEVMARNACRCF